MKNLFEFLRFAVTDEETKSKFIGTGIILIICIWAVVIAELIKARG